MKLKIKNNRKIFFTSDHHFGHTNIINFCNRPFNNAEEMNEKLIENWNSVVFNGDTVFHLGDFAYRNSKAIEKYRNKLNGNIILIKGNHDCENNRQIQHLFDQIYDYLEIDVRDDDAPKDWQHIVLSHYPFLSWNKAFYGSWMFHGHTHNNPMDYKHPRLINCCVENWQYTPISYDQIKQKIKDNSVKNRIF